VLARRVGIPPEEALRAANQRFRLRFETMEARAAEDGRPLTSLALEEWLRLWEQAKQATQPRD
jgi:tetrapyrrole methylase family protein / MazG family protein